MAKKAIKTVVLKVKTLKKVDFSDIFKNEKFKDLREIFNNAEHDFSFGDTDSTLISQRDFLADLEDNIEIVQDEDLPEQLDFNQIAQSVWDDFTKMINKLPKSVLIDLEN